MTKGVQGLVVFEGILVEGGTECKISELNENWPQFGQDGDIMWETLENC